MQKKYTCDYEGCTYKTLYKYDFKKHISGKHIEESMQKKYTCDYEGCTYKTLYMHKLRNHIETEHEGIVRFRCEFMNCNFVTNERRAMKDHTEKHNNENAYKCNSCDKTFARNRNKESHIKTIHKVEA